VSLARIDVSSDEAARGLESITRQVEKEVDNAAERITELGVDSAKKQLVRNRSVASETGIRSLKSEKIDDNHYAVKGRSYLKLVDSGTKPHTPDINTRLIIWASQEGWTVSEIVNHIEEEGTKPHEWMEPAFDPLVKTVSSRVAQHLERNVGVNAPTKIKVNTR